MKKNIKIQKKYLIFREEAKKLKKILNQELKKSGSKSIFLDFDNVNFISRSFADQFLELLISYKAEHINIKLINLKPSIEKIIKLVKKRKEKIKKEFAFH